MATALLTLNTTVPTRGLPGSPVVVFYDNGDWEITFAGDVDFRGNSLGSYSFIDLIADLFVEFEIGDEDDIDTAGEVTYLYISQKVEKDGEEEPVLGIYGDGEAVLTNRSDAENLIKLDPEFINFAPVIDIFEEFRRWRSQVSDDLFDDRTPIDEDDEESSYNNLDND